MSQPNKATIRTTSNKTATTTTSSKAKRTKPNSMLTNFTFRARHIWVVVVVILSGVTLFMTLASPFSLFHLKQSETTQLKSVIIVGRHGEPAPTADHYFIGEDPPDLVANAAGHQELTNRGKERLYLLGRYLKLRYYESLLEGNPRKLVVRSADSDRCLESAQALVAGLNPPRDKWIWSQDLVGWQPKAVHTTESNQDDLLSSESQCLRSDLYQTAWKNSTRYLQLLNEFRHDLQLLRQNTGLEFEDDLEMVIRIDQALKTRQAVDTTTTTGGSGSNSVPAWYTPTYAHRLAHIADVATGTRYKSAEMQQLLVGRLVHEITENIFQKIKADLTANGASILGDPPSQRSEGLDNTYRIHNNPDDSVDYLGSSAAAAAAAAAATSGPANKLLATAPDRSRDSEANMFVYMTDGQHLSALLNSLQIYTSQPNFGALLLIELHYDPVNQVHFLRLFTIDSPSYNVLPEPVRVNPVACRDTVECSPQQFERNIRHLALRKQAWQQLCADRMTPSFMTSTPPPPPPSSSSYLTPTQRSDEPTTPTSSGVLTSESTMTTTTLGSNSDSLLAASTTTTGPKSPNDLATEQPSPRLDQSSASSSSMDEDGLIVGPTNVRPPVDLDGHEPIDQQTNEVSPLNPFQETDSPTTTGAPVAVELDTISSTATTVPNAVESSTSDEIHLEPLRVRLMKAGDDETVGAPSSPDGHDTRDIYYMDMSK